MSWIKVDDHFDEHPKMARVGPLGWGVWLAGLAYANRNLTDGFIPIEVAEAIGGRWRVRCDGLVWSICRTSGADGEDMTSEWVTDLLIDAGLWEVAEDGYRIHDYAQYQPTRADADARADDIRAKRAAAGKVGGVRSGASKRAANMSVTEATAKQTESKSEANGKQKRSPDPDPDPDPETTPKPPPAGEESLRSGEDPDPPSFATRLQACLSFPGDPVEQAAKERLYPVWQSVCASKRLGCPPWKSAREPLTRALLWTADLAAEHGIPPGDVLEAALDKLGAGLRTSAGVERMAGCGERIGQTLEVWGRRHDWEEVLGQLVGRAGLRSRPNGQPSAPPSAGPDGEPRRGEFVP